MSPKIVVSVVLLAAAGALGGCAQNGPSGFTSAAGGGSCQSARAELNRLDAQGVPSKIQAQQAGAKMSAQSQSQIDRYNDMLNVYLGSGCANPPG